MIEPRIGIIAGSFDVIHPGYIELFKEAALSCDFLMVALQTDPTVERPEKLKPILTFQERMDMLTSIRYIDGVIPYTTEEDLLNILKSSTFNVRILGDDYKNKYATGQEYSEHIVYVDRSHGWSTTKYKQMIAKSLKRRKK